MLIILEINFNKKPASYSQVMSIKKIVSKTQGLKYEALKDLGNPFIFGMFIIYFLLTTGMWNYNCFLFF
jgi:hypothetical protein